MSKIYGKGVQVVLNLLKYSILFYLIFLCNKVTAFAVESIYIEDQDGFQWLPGETNNINIFNSIHDSEVASPTFKGEKLLAPGTKGIYEFRIYNKSNHQILFRLLGSDENKSNVPLNFKIKIDSNEWIKGTKNEWEYCEESFPINYQKKLEQDEYSAVEIQWEWPFERGLDLEDSKFGNSSVKNDLEYEIGLKVIVEIDENEKKSSNNKDGYKNLPKTGGHSDKTIVFLGVTIVFWTILGFLLLRGRYPGEKYF